MKLLTIVGARPQFIKAATVSRRVREPDFSSKLDEVIVHTGQHYDANMSQVFFDELEIPPPAHHLGVGSASQAAQTAGIMVALEPVIESEAPDMMLVYGDTNSTLAGALVAAKAGIPLAHVEAGLRSHRRGMSEEVNRIVTDRLSDLLFCPTEEAMTNLAIEGRPDAISVGDVMLDGYRFAEARAGTDTLDRIGVSANGYALATIHRAESTDDPVRLAALLDGLAALSADLPVVLPLHPRTRAKANEADIDLPPTLTIVEPVPYLDMVALLSNAVVIATDSGGLQKEAAFARVPCVTLREETEWVETVETGWNRLPSLTGHGIATALRRARTLPDGPPPDYGDGDAAGKIVQALLDWQQ